MSLLQSNSKVTTSTGFYDFEIGQSLRFDGSSYLSRTPTTTSNRKTWTWSSWVKRSKLSQTQGVFTGNDLEFYLSGSDILGAQNNGGSVYLSSAVLRDMSAFYHLVIKFDAANTSVNVYLNGVDIDLPTKNISNTNYSVNNTVSHYIGSRNSNIDKFYGYIAEINFIDGSALTPTSFGETKNGVWIPKAYTGSYGTNGFRLTFENGIETIGGVANQIRDESSNSNHWTKN